LRTILAFWEITVISSPEARFLVPKTTGEYERGKEERKREN
jgi:hypothetical protein